MKIRLIVVCVVLFAGLCSAQRIVRHKLGGVRKIEFQQDTTAPVTAITSPANLATVSGTISVTATSSDNVGVVKLELYVDATVYSTILTPPSPATFTWNTSTYSNASHTLQTKAYDAAGNTGSSTVINVTVNNAAAGVFYAALPTNWQDPTECNPTGGVYDTTVTLGVTTNLGPSVQGGAEGAVYAASILGLRDAVRNWRDNADNVTPNPTPHYSDKWWLIKVPAQSTGTILAGSSYDGDNALVTMPGKLNPTNNTEPTKCLVIESTTPLNRYSVAGSVTAGTFTLGERVRQGTSLAETTLNNAVTGSNPMLTGPMTNYYDATHTWVGQSSGAVFTPTGAPKRVMACGRGLPGFGGTRNPGCDGHIAGPNDRASMFRIQMTTVPQPGYSGIYEGDDYENPLGITGSCLTYTTCTPYTNHVVIRDIEVTMAPGAAQSKAGVKAARPVNVSSNGGGNFPPLPVPRNVGLESYYVHGWDPGDPGQPKTGPSVDSAGNCKAWDFSGTVTTANSGGSNGTITWASGNYFGMTFTVGSTITLTIAGVPTAFTISAFDPSATSKVLTVTGQPGLNTVPIPYSEANPPANYTPGCGDDVQTAVDFNCDQCWREAGYIEKVHIWGGESHSSNQGFSHGVYKDTENWEEGGACAWFSGGAAIDTNNGPESDNEIRGNYHGRDLNYRTLSARAGNSPAPPFGCGPVDGGHTCPMNWGIKNSMELKLGHRNLIDGNIIENSWPDGQTGPIMDINVRVCSGGSACGIYDPVTGLPLTAIDNIRVSNNWFRNAANGIEQATRSGSPGNGGGNGLPGTSRDYINNLFSNFSDTNQFGLNGFFEWATGGTAFTCAMSGTGSVATGTCVPFQSDFTAKVTKISSVANVVTVVSNNRTDPILCLGLPATQAACLAAGQTAMMSGAVGPWNGTFVIAGTNNNWGADGTGGYNVSYTDNINNPGTATYCANQSDGVPPNPPHCSGLGFTSTWASLGYKMTDICYPSQTGCGQQPDDVHATNTCQGTNCSKGGDTTCATQGYAWPGPTAVYAAAGTVTEGLIVKFASTGTGTATCFIDNITGFPKFTSLQNNTFLSVGSFSVNVFNNYQQAIGNALFNNVFADNDTHLTSAFYCGGFSEGVTSLACWDNATLSFYSNVLVGRAAAQWTVAGSSINCPTAPCTTNYPNFIPTGGGPGGAGGGVNCSGAPTVNCMGYTGFEGGSPTVTFPTGPCVYDGSNPYNCPLMALPWANNFSLGNITYDGASSYSAYGVDTTKMTDAMTKSLYVCPTGANCGDGSAGHHPYPD
jgi:hypothetical protein